MFNPYLWLKEIQSAITLMLIYFTAQRGMDIIFLNHILDLELL